MATRDWREPRRSASAAAADAGALGAPRVDAVRSSILRNIAAGLAGSFVSRNSDSDGDWAAGKLRSLAAQHGVDEFRIPIRPTADPARECPEPGTGERRMVRTSKLLAAGFLGAGFAWISYVAIFVEPDMGFVSLPADFFDSQKVAAGYASSVWLVSNFIGLLFPVAIMAIVYSGDDRLLRWAGVGASLVWLVVGAVDRIAIELPTLVPTNEAVIAAVGALLPIRFALLKSAVVTLGVFAWRTTRPGVSPGAAPGLWAGFGWLVLALSVAFMFVLVPVPIVFTIWSVVLFLRYWAAPQPNTEP